MGITVFSLFIMQDLYHPLHWLCSKHTKSQVGCYAIGTTVEQLGSFFLLYIHIYIYVYLHSQATKLRRLRAVRLLESRGSKALSGLQVST